MIFGVGTDLLDVARMEAQLSGDTGFLERVFTPDERAYCDTKRNRAQHYAVRFAAKEAFFKAMGTGWRDGLAFRDVGVVNDDLGKPVLVFNGKTQGRVKECGITGVHLSMTHIKDVVNAVVILESQ